MLEAWKVQGGDLLWFMWTCDKRWRPVINPKPTAQRPNRKDSYRVIKRKWGTKQKQASFKVARTFSALRCHKQQSDTEAFLSLKLIWAKLIAWTCCVKTNIHLPWHVRKRQGLNKVCGTLASRPQITAWPVHSSIPPSSLSSSPSENSPLGLSTLSWKNHQNSRLHVHDFLANVGVEVQAPYLLFLISHGPSKHMLKNRVSKWQSVRLPHHLFTDLNASLIVTATKQNPSHCFLSVFSVNLTHETETGLLQYSPICHYIKPRTDKWVMGVHVMEGVLGCLGGWFVTIGISMKARIQGFIPEYCTV